MQKYRHTRQLVYLTLFFLLIGGGLRLLFYLTGNGNPEGKGHVQVWVLQPSLIKTDQSEWSLAFAGHGGLSVSDLETERLFDLPSDDRSVFLLDFSLTGNPPMLYGQPLMQQLLQRVSTGSLLVLIGQSPGFFEDSSSEPSAAMPGFYPAWLLPASDSTVVWLDSPGRHDWPGGTAHLIAEAMIDSVRVPVAWRQKKGKGEVIVSLFNPLFTPGGKALAMQWFRGDTATHGMDSAFPTPRSYSANEVQHWLYLLQSDDERQQLEGIRQLTKASHPLGRKVLPPMLYSPHRQVAVAAAEGLLLLQAFAAIPALEAAATCQPHEMKPILLRVASDLRETAQQ